MSDSTPLSSPPGSFSIAEPRQARSRRTLERIVRAARELIAERGVEGVTVLEIVERADSSVGSFYARFPGKDELVAYLNERTRAEAAERWDAVVAEREWEALDFRGTMEGLIGMLLELCRDDTAWRRAFIEGGEWEATREPATPTRMLEKRMLQDHILRDFERLLLRSSREITHPNAKLAVRIGFRILIGGIRELLAQDGGRVDEEGQQGEPVTPLDDGRLVVELARSFLGYLGARTAPGGDLMMDDPFNIWA